MNDQLTAALEARGLDPEVLTRYGVRESVERGPEWVDIPFFVGEEVVNVKSRTIIHPSVPEEEAKARKRMLQREGGACVFWNRNAITDPTLKHLPLIITEGELDALSAVQAGYPRTVSVPNGAPSKPVEFDTDSSKYDYLEMDILDGVSEVILAVDDDLAGSHLLQYLKTRIGPARCKWIRYPVHPDKSRRLKDLNEVLQFYGTAGVKKTIDRADWVAVDGVYTLSQLPPIPERPAFYSYMPGMDDHYRIRLGDLTVVTGIPNHGKTSWVNDMVCRLADRLKWRICWAGFEQEPQTDHRRYLLQWVDGKPIAFQNPEEIRRGEKWIEDHFVFVTEGIDGDLTLEGVLEKCAAAVKRYGCQVVVLDPWNRLEHAVERNSNMHQYIGRALREFARFARHFHVHFIVIAHPRKMNKDPDGNFEIPDLYSISDSANWYNMVDVGFVVHRVEDKSFIGVLKTKYHDQIGRPGTVETWLNTETGRFQAGDGSTLAKYIKQGKIHQ